MKKLFTLFGLISLIPFSVISQVVNEDVHFDAYQSITDHDFVNYFDGGAGLIQNQTGGITGGCLATPDSINWGNDNAIYCSHYKPVVGDTTVTSLCFKYDSTTVSTGSFQRAVSIFLNPNADFNHYVIASVSGTKKIEILSYGWNLNPSPNLVLLHNHWYRFELKVFLVAASQQVHARAEVFDLGVSGTDPAISVNSGGGTFNDSILAVDTMIRVSFTATAFGGAALVDDFHFHGGKGQSNCVITIGIDDPQINSINVYPTLAQNFLHINGNERGKEMLVTIYDAIGKKMLERNTIEEHMEMNIEKLSNGIFYLNCLVEHKSRTFKVVVLK